MSFFCNVASHRRLVAEQVTSDEHCHICSVWSSDEHHTTMIFEGRARPRRWLSWLLSYLGCVVSWHMSTTMTFEGRWRRSLGCHEGSCSVFVEHNSSVLVRLVFALCVLVMYSIQQCSHLVDTVSKIISLFYCTVWFCGTHLLQWHLRDVCSNVFVLTWGVFSDCAA